MDRPFLTLLAAGFREQLLRRRKTIEEATGRFPKRKIFAALDGCKPLFAEKFGCVTWSRWSLKRTRVSNTKVLAYLLDYSISRNSIPQAIHQLKDDHPELPAGQKYGMLLGVESEMGDDEEVARDFLKLMDFKSPVKLMIFEARPDYSALYQRLEWVMSHHSSYTDDESILLIGLPRPSSGNWTEHIEIKCVETGAVVNL